MKTMAPPAPILVRRSTDNRVIAVILNGVLVKRVKESVHLYRTHNAYPLDAMAFRRHYGQMVAMEFRDVEIGKVYRCRPFDFLQNARKIDHPKHGAQLAVPRDADCWEVADMEGWQPRLL